MEKVRCVPGSDQMHPEMNPAQGFPPTCGDADFATDDVRRPIVIARRFYTRSDLVKTLLAAQKRERDQVLAEVVKIKGFMPLLMKPRNGMQWTSSERAELAAQAKAIVYLSPYLVVMILPGSFMYLPLLAWWLDRRRQKREDAALGA